MKEVTHSIQVHIHVDEFYDKDKAQSWVNKNTKYLLFYWCPNVPVESVPEF